MIGKTHGVVPPLLTPPPSVPQLQLASLERIEKLLERLLNRKLAEDAKAYAPPQQGQAGGKQRRS